MFLKSQSRRAKDDAFHSGQCHARCTTSRKPGHFVQNAQNMNQRRSRALSQSKPAEGTEVAPREQILPVIGNEHLVNLF
jgi:hypothetical protein